MRSLLVIGLLLPAAAYQLPAYQPRTPLGPCAASLRASRPVACSAKPVEEELLYAVGLTVARQLNELTVLMSKEELRTVGTALAARLVEEERADFDWDTYGPQVEGFLATRQASAREAASEAGAAFIEAAAAEAGAVRTSTGMVYMETAAGSGAQAGPGKKVTAHYTGKLTDGTVFDSSVARGEPLTFPIESVIKGWQEGLALMKEGGSAVLTIPSELGYGDAGTGPIPPGATLVFDVQLLKVEE